MSYLTKYVQPCHYVKVSKIVCGVEKSWERDRNSSWIIFKNFSHSQNLVKCDQCLAWLIDIRSKELDDLKSRLSILRNTKTAEFSIPHDGTGYADE